MAIVTHRSGMAYAWRRGALIKRIGMANGGENQRRNGAKLCLSLLSSRQQVARWQYRNNRSQQRIAAASAGAWQRIHQRRI